jgi:hypothetical protein
MADCSVERGNYFIERFRGDDAESLDFNTRYHRQSPSFALQFDSSLLSQCWIQHKTEPRLSGHHLGKRLLCFFQRNSLDYWCDALQRTETQSVFLVNGRADEVTCHRSASDDKLRQVNLGRIKRNAERNEPVRPQRRDERTAVLPEWDSPAPLESFLWCIRPSISISGAHRF